MLNGLHLYRSKEGKNWKKVKNLPIISGLRNGVDLNGMLGYASFDATSSVVYSDDLKKYILYQRANPATNRRYISYCTSKDLINWSKFKMLPIVDSSWKYDSFYCPYIYKASGYYIGVVPHLVIKKELYVDGGILLMMSKDGITWRKRNHFIDYKVKNDHRPLIPKTNLYNKLLYYPVGGSLIESDDKKSLYFYIHSLKHNRIERYITRRNGLTYFCQKDFSRPAKFCTKLLTKPTQSFGLSLNFNSKPGGTIHVELCDEKKQIIPGCSFSDCDPLTGDYLSKQPTWKTRKITDFPELSNFHIRFSLMNTNLFSFNLTNEIELVN
jgi:hypothetical protein